MSQEDRLRIFLSKIFKSGNGCWIWMGAVCRWTRKPGDGGYGIFWDGKKAVRAHRWIYERLVRKVSGKRVLLHSCDDRRCVNVWHTYEGTQRENVTDMIRKGRAMLFGKRFPEARAD